MLIGEFQHTLDAKKRVALPAKLRKELGNNAVITKGLDRCLYVYPIKEWEHIAEKLSNLPMGQADTRRFVRFFLGGAAHVEMDALGRVLIPETLKEYAGLSERVVVAGVHKYLEIWDATRWDSYKSEIEKQADVLAEKLGEIGAY
ncbi:MAG: cell division/cell wall cluster transcriptional repressor MraZ [Candidatus Niyogibacteria bacterium RIFCSPLOWO2_01_FULL_45_48]|uniref:Transcriptional regulator MraZ n=2 Tax=Candidatus Niyogiibacteriota TaxID=1817912 RepID=A0A1G2F1M3_9BACT|nr:MAG: cell division/cell wall cluster transcriptional repressor MraZ [Candidatus Niyogibacteria bacterium RIFCSPLOWO2_01_FULL_45_48]OGZ30544.1 MAG: cell division/cell wall cluster transcriptional repressor MraZ [Candidatus Niyogibacteria bacterium RIFCSPHIGHO2_01_FULL_45_28]OGZ31662.1 MAG: cell division/cell wall cluster transcriptional repressor MraZ [Candidatus Niyogibacteria bacterium RIFCSPLOWO2_02_FULL_45_13]